MMRGAIAHDIANAYSILVPGNFQALDLDDFDFPPKGWLALIAKDGHWELTPAKVNIENEVVSSDQPHALVLLHERTLTPGKVTTPNIKFLKNPKRMSLAGQSMIAFVYNGANYRVSFNKSGVIILQSGKMATILDQHREEASLVWAGDLDKDGKPDLIIDSGTEKNSTYCLYLSGTAGEKALVKKMGCQFFSG